MRTKQFLNFINEKLIELRNNMSLNDSKLQKNHINTQDVNRDPPDFLLREIMASFMLISAENNDGIFPSNFVKL